METMETQIVPVQMPMQKSRLDACALLEQCPDMQRILAQVRQLALGDATILLVGETGTGKEVVAEAIHQLSSRQKRRWVVVNCPAIPETLAESTLFGHERGAFTGAIGRHHGLFEQAHESTVFLDEIGKLPLGAQAKLLRVLDGKPFSRVGGTGEIYSDFRAVAATNCDLRQMVKDRDFLEDLFYRLNVVTLHVPPLRERRQDVLPLTRHFISVFSRRSDMDIGGESEQVLTSHTWPGNVRELQHTIQRAVAWVNGGNVIYPEHLRLEYPRHPLPRDPCLLDGALDTIAEFADHAPFRETVELVERRIIQRALRECGGNAVQAAARLQMSRDVLRWRMQRFGMRGRN